MSDAYLYLSEIRIDGDTQVRLSMEEEEIEYFAGIMKTHGEHACPFPPVKVIYDGQDRWLYDGFHRHEAARRAGYSKLRATVEPGTLEDARWQCLSVNKKRAIPRTQADKRNAVLRAMAHARGQGLSEGLIAEHCGVSQATVSRIKKELAKQQPQKETLPIPSEETISSETTHTMYELSDTPANDEQPTSKPEKKIRTKNGKTMDATKIGKGRKPKPVDTSTPGVTIPPNDMIYVNRNHCYHAIDCSCHAHCTFGEPVTVDSDDIFK